MFATSALLIFVSLIGLSHQDLSATAGIVSNIAYWHLLDCYATANHTDPLQSLLRLTIDDSLSISAKRRADECPTEHSIKVGNNLTEIFLVSEIKKNQLNAKAREKLRRDETGMKNVDEMARIMFAAYYTDQFNLVFNNATVAEKATIGDELNGVFNFGCDMNVCKKNGHKIGIIVCQFTRGVPRPKKIITKAEYEERYGKKSSAFALSFMSTFIFMAVTLYKFL
uniref:SCP domain-containing protein n=1 Tax=Caenorhabditis japonica TaxID=281687 RepID=A0A8R1DQZ9_CAEJA